MLALSPAESFRSRFTTMLIALALHGAFIIIAARLHRVRPTPAPPLITELLELEAPPIVPAPSPAEPAPAPVTRSRAPLAPRAAHSAPSPPPAQPSPQPADSTEEVLDFDSTLVTTTASSSSSLAARAGSSAGGAAHGARHALAARPSTGTGDLSRAPALAGATEWRCPFPPEADAAAIDHAVVTLRVDVSASGEVSSARTLDDPGHGFAQKACACALRKRFSPALDRDGAPMRSTATVHVTFDR
jgi:protein TonB